MLVPSAVTCAIALVLALGFRPSLAGTPTLWLGVGVPYVLLGGFALFYLQRRDRLRALFRFKSGDASLGIVIGLALLVGAWLFAKRWLPLDSPQHAWLLRVFLLAGDVSSPVASSALLLIILSEELVWRGWIQALLRERLGPRRAWFVCALLYGAAHLPSVVTLQDPAAGANPLLVLAALGCGMCWSLLAERSGRLLPSLFSHVVFSYFAANATWWFV
jgi:membrane protease YdiL (CAAX protease family)